MTSFPRSAGTARPYVWTPDQSPAYWNVGTYWRVLADGSQTDGRSCTFEELCPQGPVAPPHVHDKEKEAFFILEGDFVFTVGDEEIPAGPGSYIYLPPKVRHGFRVESEVGRVYNMLTSAGFEQNIITNGQPAPQVSKTIPASTTLSSPSAPAGSTCKKAGGASSAKLPSPAGRSPTATTLHTPPPSPPASSTPVRPPGSGADPPHQPANYGADIRTPFEESSTSPRKPS